MVNAPFVVLALCALILLAHLAALGLFGGGAQAEQIALWIGAVRTASYPSYSPSRSHPDLGDTYSGDTVILDVRKFTVDVLG